MIGVMKTINKSGAKRACVCRLKLSSKVQAQSAGRQAEGRQKSGKPKNAQKRHFWASRNVRKRANARTRPHSPTNAG
jgi:hypothetical protein